ncbi:hypothetical protein PCANC_28094, partial [Puccinia coronata f. sp. avenae]
MCTPTIGVHMASRRARQACRACTPVWKACKACTPFGQACRLCTPVGSRKPLKLRGLRYPYPYKGTRSTLIRVLRTLIAGLTSASRFERLTGLREPAQVSSAGTDLGVGTETRHHPHKPEPTHPTTTQRTHHR